jgi:serine/threonine-protein kinase
MVLGRGAGPKFGDSMPDDGGAHGCDEPNEAVGFVGQTIAGKFVIEARIAAGSSGTVFRARQPALDRTVALKLLHEDFARDPMFIERFKREARAASRLDHPNSVRVLDFGEHEGSRLYLAMEYVEGRSLHEIIDQDWPLSEARMVDLICQVLSAIAVAHDLGVIHRDLKPDNILVVERSGDDGERVEVAKVCDFGIATLRLANGALPASLATAGAAGTQVTNDGFLVGTPAYMSPEQAHGDPTDARSDIYSVGVILYHLLARRAPFDGETVQLVAAKHIIEAPRPPSAFAQVNPVLEAICLRALRKVPEERFWTAREMRAALRAALQTRGDARSDAPVVPSPLSESSDVLDAGQAPSAEARPRGRRWLFGVGAIAVCGTVLAAWKGGVLLQTHRGVDATMSALPRVSTAGETRAAPSTPIESPPPVASPTPTDERPLARAAPLVRPNRAHRSPRRLAETVVEGHAQSAPPVVVEEIEPASPPVPVVPAATSASRPVSLPPKVTVDPEQARVETVAVDAANGVARANVRSALVRAPLTRCYRDALRALGGAQAANGNAILHLRIDVDGYVTRAALEGDGLLGSLRSCIERAANGAHVKDVDTGEAAADVTLRFVAGP